jgi:hypothetical protein
VPAVGWVAFNILQPFFNQMGRMQEMNEDATSGGKGKRRGVAAAAGLGAALAAMAADQADAAQEVMQLAGDNRWVGGGAPVPGSPPMQQRGSALHAVATRAPPPPLRCLVPGLACSPPRLRPR